jgi:hypothetical protein
MCEGHKQLRQRSPKEIARVTGKRTPFQPMTGQKEILHLRRVHDGNNSFLMAIAGDLRNLFSAPLPC